MAEAAVIPEPAEVTVVFSPAPGCEEQIRVKWIPGAGVSALIAASGLPQRYPAFDFARAHTGIWGKLVSGDTPVRVHDRIEIYRPLQVDPKVARARRASKKNKTRQARAASPPLIPFLIQ